MARGSSVRLAKYLLAGVVLFCVSWIVCVSEWHAHSASPPRSAFSTMPTIVAYSAGKQAELDRPSPVLCDQIPAFPTIPYINRTWVHGDEQPGWSSWQRVPGTGVSLYSAYYDQRLPQHYIRILAIFQGRTFSNNEQLYCQTRSQNPYEISVEVVAAKPMEIWWPGWDRESTQVETPLLLSCPLTEPLTGPAVVSVVTEPCDYPTNAFYLEPSPKTSLERNFTICVKDMNFEKDISVQLVEWIETNKILGAEKIDVYVDKISDKVAKVIEHYRNVNGFLRVFQVPINSDVRALWQRRRDHIITYNDCLYRNIHESQFIIPLDVDEILIPKLSNTWLQLILRLKERGWNPSINSAILVRNVFFFDFMQGINKYKYSNLRSNNSKVLYVKRDDVRLEEFGEIELVVENDLVQNNLVYNRNNEVIDYKSDLEELMQRYRNRCGFEMSVPRLARHLVRSNVVSPFGHYSKSMMLTKKVLTAFNHYPLASLGMSGFSGWAAPFSEVQLNHYKETCNSTVVSECSRYGRRARIDSSALRLHRKLTRALALGPCTAQKNNT